MQVFDGENIPTYLQNVGITKNCLKIGLQLLE